ncbi:MAG: Uma2 family endonuclease [Bacteroidetes bacterium]|nr:MAG: Uma2 family endonuclease [Bacteroidota bacterium]
MVTIQKYTIDEYYRFTERVAGGFEFVHGQIIALHSGEPVESSLVDYVLSDSFDDTQLPAFPMATRTHDILVSNLHGLLFMALRKQPFQVYSQQTSITTDSGEKTRLPDVAVVSKETEQRNEQHAVQNPVALFEVLSKSTTKIDQTDKLEEYQSLETVADYLMIAQDKIRITHYTRLAPNKWEEKIYLQTTENISIESLQITLNVGEIYENTTL